MKILKVFVFLILVFILQSCDLFLPTGPDIEIKDAITATLSQPIYQFMELEYLTLYNEEKAQISTDNQEAYNLLYDQWQRNLITTAEFQAGFDQLNEDYNAAIADLEYRRLTEPWWGNVYPNINITNSIDYDFVYCSINIEVNYFDNTSEIFYTYIGDIPANYDGVFPTTIITDRAVKSYSVKEIDGVIDARQ